MLKPNEHKSVQARILKYAEEIGWTFVSQGEDGAPPNRQETASGRRGKVFSNQIQTVDD
jgi:hypothetical protein